jgi:hypothetical protein
MAKSNGRVFIAPVCALIALVGPALFSPGASGLPKTEALKLLEEVSDQPASSYSLAGVYGALGETDKAFEMLNRAYLDRDLQLVSLKVDPTLDELRGDPRFADLVRRVGLPDQN